MSIVKGTLYLTQTGGYAIYLAEINIVILQKMENKIVEQHILEPLEGSEWPKVYDVPPYSLTIPSDKVKEIKLLKPTGKIFWI